MKRTTFRVLTWNIRKCKGGFRGPVTPADVGASVAARRPDIVLCQEVFHDAGPLGASQSEELAGALDLVHRYVPNAVYGRGHHGNATLTRFRIVETRHHDISTNRFEKRGLLHTVLDVGGVALHVLNTHLGLNRRQRRIQIERIAAAIADVPDCDPLILAGDFNDWTGRLEPFIIERCRVTSALGRLAPTERRSWPSPRPILPLDRIYVRRLDVIGVEVIREPPFDRLSDHLPLVADLAIQSNGETR